MTRPYRGFLPPARALLPLAVIALWLIVAIAAIRGCAFNARAGEPSGPPYGSAVEVLVYNDDTGKLMRMTLEEYLLGVVPAEMPASFEPEALKAQAVAARTFALRRIAAYGGAPCGRHGCDICTDSTCCQAWRSDESLQKGYGSSYGYYMGRIEDAVRATAGEIIVYNGKPIEALYHSTSGGMTEDAANVFGSDEPYLVSVASPGEEGSSNYKNSLALSRKAFTGKVNAAFKKAKLKEKRLESQVEIVSRFPSGRVEKLKLGEVTVTGREFRKAFDLNSANFTLTIAKSGVRIQTTGYGHGVGMSQYGANAMAKAGSGYVDILTHYYTGVSIEGIDALTAP